MADISESKRMESTLLRLQAMTRRYIDAQESRRGRVVQELHNSVLSNLTAIGLSIGLIEAYLGQEIAYKIRGRLADTMALLKDTIDKCRDISSNLHPAGLEHAGLLPALRDYGRQYSARTGISVEVSGTKDIHVPPEHGIALYRIAEEALDNSAKHAQARMVRIDLALDDEHVVFTISDNGEGFDMNQFDRHDKSALGGLGMLLMRECAEAIGATLEVESTPEQGTRIVVCKRITSEQNTASCVP